MVHESTRAGSSKRHSGPDPIDVHVGSRLRMRRSLLGMTQEQLGKTCDLTFQQIQKYERGVNRMGASRLFKFALALAVPVAYFFEELSTIGTESSFSSSGLNDNEQEPYDASGDNVKELLYRRETLELIRAYYRISDPKQRRKVYELIKTMSDQT